MRDTSEDLKCCGLHEQGTENYDVRCENCQLRCRGKGGCNALKPLGQFTLQHRRDRRDGSQVLPLQSSGTSLALRSMQNRREVFFVSAGLCKTPALEPRTVEAHMQNMCQSCGG